jgi:predicted YcjX-like family ATPase
LNIDKEKIRNIKDTIENLPRGGEVILQITLLQEILETLKYGNKDFLESLTNETLRKICKDKKIADKDLKTKEDLINAIAK